MGKRKTRDEPLIGGLEDHGTPIAQDPELKRSKRQLTALHRAKFLEWRPSASVACASTDDGSLLAVARESGNIELWDTESWAIIGVLQGSKDLALTSLVWIKEASSDRWRLFSGGLDGSLVEWDLLEKMPCAFTDSLGGAVWSIALQPEPSENEGRKLAVACDDGCLRVFRLEDGQNGLIYDYSLPPLPYRLLSVAWHPNGKNLYSGTSEASLHAWDTGARREVFRIHTGDESKENFDVWAVKILPDGTIVSGDGGGNLQFWDAAHGTLLTSIKQHKADILSLAVNSDGSRIFAGGVDSQIAVYQKVDSSQDSTSQWEFLTSKRPHTHDVRFLSIVGGNESSSLLISGGNDAQLFGYSVQNFLKEHPTRLTRIPEPPRIQITRVLPDGFSLISSVEYEQCKLWRINTSIQNQGILNDDGVREGQKINGTKIPELLGTIHLRNRGYISVSAISEDGGHLFIGNAEENALFSVDLQGGSDGPISELSVKGWKGHKFQAATFCGTKLTLIGSKGQISTLDLSRTHKKAKLIPLSRVEFPKHNSKLASQQLDNMIDGAIFSKHSGKIAIWTLHLIYILGPDGQQLGQIEISREKGVITTVAFGKEGKNILIGTASNALLNYDTTSFQVIPWALELKPVLQHKLQSMPGSITNISILPDDQRDAAIITTPSSTLFVDFEAPVSPLEITSKRERWKNLPSKTAQFADKAGINARVMNLELPCLACEFVSSQALVLCEKDWSEVQGSFPAPVYRHKYGT